MVRDTIIYPSSIFLPLFILPSPYSSPHPPPIPPLPLFLSSPYSSPPPPPAALAVGNAEESLMQAEQVMKKVQSLSNEDLPNKLEFVASLHSCIGNAQLELGEAEEALAHHLQDLKIAEEKSVRGQGWESLYLPNHLCLY